MIEKGGSSKKPLRESPLPPPPEGPASKVFSKPAEYAPPPRIDVTGQTFLADTSLTEIDVPPPPEAAPETRTVRPGAKKEQVPQAPETAREQEPRGPVFEAASNVPGKRGEAGVAVNPDTGTFVFVAGDKADPSAVEGIIDSALSRLEEGAAQDTQATASSWGETTRTRASAIDTRLLSAATRGALDAVVRENAHKLARGDNASAIEVPPFVVGQIFNEEITSKEFFGDQRSTEDTIGKLVDMGTRGLEEHERASTQAVQDALTRMESARAQVKDWLKADPLAKWPTRSDLASDESITAEQRAYIAQVFDTQDALSAIGPTHKQLENNIEIAKILARKVEEMRQRRLSETDEQFEESYRALKNDPELAKLATENLPILLKRLEQDIVLTPETAKTFAAPELTPEQQTQVKEAADKLNALFKKTRDPKTETERQAAAQAAMTYFNSPSVQRLMASPAERLALYQSLSNPNEGTLDIFLRHDVKAVPKDPERAARLKEPALSVEESRTVDDVTYDMKRTGEDPMQLLKDPRFTGLSRAGRFSVVERLKNLQIVEPDQGAALLKAQRMILRGKPGEALTVFTVGRDGVVKKIDTGARSGARGEKVNVTERDPETDRITSSVHREIREQSNAAVDIGVQVGDQIVVVPTTSEEYVMGQLERAGTEGVEKVLAEMKGDFNRSAKANSKRLSDTTGRPHLVLRIPT